MDYNFYDEMNICKGRRKDGSAGRCIDTCMHDLGCVHCPVENELYEPPAVEDLE